ncbi:MAG TPA: porphobilinogen synthase [Actinomycetota bacterium]|jgi:porphobilinogen synthase|nr:porphobilinogen synthase [Actinomycetota bacterium]
MSPAQRPRRLRRTEALRALTRETDLSPHRLIAPLFVKEGISAPEPIDSMPGQLQHTLESLAKEAREIRSRGVRALLVFGIPARKDGVGSQAYAPDGISQLGLKALREELGDEAVVIGDLCLCEYTDHGHCGVLRSGSVLNDETVELYARTAIAQAEAGADFVAPSGMMDGQVASIRSALDGAGHEDTAIMAYAAKYASVHYGPFREAAECAPQEGDRAGYQMDPPNVREALREVALDVEEGADVVMVKPALPYLDVIRAVADISPVPVAAYNVSGEYSMVKAAAERGWIDGDRIALEHLTAIRRAGADLVITYFAKEIAEQL